MENLKFLVFWDSNPGPYTSKVCDFTRRIFSFPAKIKILSFFFHLHDENEEAKRIMKTCKSFHNFNGKNPKMFSGIRTRDQADRLPHPNQYDD